MIRVCRTSWMLQIQEKIGQVNLLQMAICLFVYFGLFVPLENLLLIWRSHHYRWSATNFDLCSALMPIEQWGFFSMPHLLWHGASIYNGHHRGPVTLKPIAERWAGELSLPIFTTYVCRLGFEHPIFRLRGERSNQLRHRRRNGKFKMVHTVQRGACLILKFQNALFLKNR